MKTLIELLKNKSFQFTCTLILASMWSPAARADVIFYIISVDPNTFYAPDILSSVDSGTQTVNNIAAMGGGNLGFNGGLTVAGGTLYSIANDSQGNSSFYNIHP